LIIQTPEEKLEPFVDFLCTLADGLLGFRILLTLQADYRCVDPSMSLIGNPRLSTCISRDLIGYLAS
jgi:hypothetical protein